MELVEITLALLLGVAAAGAVAKWLPVPLPIILVAEGILLSYLPPLRTLSIEPEVFFLLFISPLLFADGWLMPKRDLLHALRRILLLAFGLVFLTVIVVGFLVHWLVPTLPLAAAFALGAVISLLTPYAAYLSAEALGVGSILAIMGAGLYAGIDDARNIDTSTRVHSWYANSLIAEYEHRVQRQSANAERRRHVDAVRDVEHRLRLAALKAERDELMQLRDTDVINDEVLRVVQSDIDHAEALILAPCAVIATAASRVASTLASGVTAFGLPPSGALGAVRHAS